MGESNSRLRNANAMHYHYANGPKKLRENMKSNFSTFNSKLSTIIAFPIVNTEADSPRVH